MIKLGAAGIVTPFRRIDQLGVLPGLGQSGRTVARLLQCKNSEDDDGAAVRRIIKLDSGRMHDSLYVAVSLLPKGG